MAIDIRGAIATAKNVDRAAPSAAESLGELVQAPAPTGTLHYTEILDRWAEDTRSLDPEHVDALAESILSLEKLLQPIAVDTANRLVAGGHRRAAVCQIVKSKKKDVVEARERIFPGGQVPVHRLNFDSAEDEAGALAAEAAENEKRKDYSAAEVKAIARKLEALGYERTVGKPKKGSKSLIKALGAITKKSRSALYNDLGSAKSGAETKAEPSNTEKAERKIANAVRALRVAATAKGLAAEDGLELLGLARGAAVYLGEAQQEEALAAIADAERRLENDGWGG